MTVATLGEKPVGQCAVQCNTDKTAFAQALVKCFVNNWKMVDRMENNDADE